MGGKVFVAMLLCTLLAASALAETRTATREATIDSGSDERATNFAVLLGSDTAEPEEPEESAVLLENYLLREDDVEGVFLVVKTRDDFFVEELPQRTREPYFVGTGVDGGWMVAQLSVKYGPVITVKPKGLVEEYELSDVFVTSYTPQPSAGVEPDEIDYAGDEATIGLLLPAVQKVRAAASDEEAAGLLLPAIQKAALKGIEPDEIDYAGTDETAMIGLLLPAVQKIRESAAPGIEPDEIDYAGTDEEAIGLLLPAVQKVRAAASDEEAIGLLLPAIQKVRAAGTDEEAISLLLPAVQKVQESPEKRGFFGRLFSFFK